MSGAMTNFRGEDMPGQISHAKDSPRGGSQQAKSGSPEPQREGTPPQGQDTQEVQQGLHDRPEVQEETPPEQESGSQVPDGTTKEILSWVGDDKARAQAALDKEKSSDKPRSTLVDDLEKKLAEG